MKEILVCLTLLILTTLISLGAQKAVSDDARYWPQWRGPFHNGMAASDAPLRWSNTENIRWKTEIPGRGFSTPVVWGERIFLTTAIPTKAATQTDRPGQRHPNGGAGAMQEHQFVVICLDRKTGAVVWQKTAKTAVPHEGYHRFYGSFASNSPVTDGKYVYAFFGSRGIYCYDLDGKLIWERNPGVQMQMRNEFGEGVAPALADNLLVLKYDHEADSFIVALDKNTGKELWRKKRDEVSSWSNPLVIEHAGRKQIVVSATGKVRSYDFKNGSVIWECAGLGLNAIPAPVHQEGIVYVMTGHRDPKLMAIKLGREGDLTGTDAVLWNETRGASYTPSPVLHDNKLYVLTDNGMVSCFNARTGEPFYHRQRLPKSYNFKASPVGANGKLYLASEDNDVIVLKMGEKYEVLATNTLDDQTFIASPIIVDNEIYLRSQQYLFCVSETGAKDKP
jgi:outer membrane protein assembly factor BamB